MPMPVFGPDDLQNPDAPEDEQRVKRDQPLVRDASFHTTRSRQRLDLFKGSFIVDAVDPFEGITVDWSDEESAAAALRDRGPKLDLYVKECPRCVGYVADFLYDAPGVPFSVYGVLVNEGSGLVVGEVEFWRYQDRSYVDQWGDYVGPDEWQRIQAEEEPDNDESEFEPFLGITSALLRRIPIGWIVARSQEALVANDWETEGVRFLPGPTLAGDELPEEVRDKLRSVNRLASMPKKGRPPLSDALLEQVAHAYLYEAARGAGMTSRLAAHFSRPEPTIRDWVGAARKRGFLSPAVRGRRGASPGPRLRRPS